MAIFTWRAKRQLIYFGIFSAIIFLVILGVISFVRQEPTCFDRTMNHGEEGIDCGGPCGSCLGDVKNITVLWTRFLEVAPAHYDVAVLVDNPNLFAGAPIVHYRIRLHDKNNVLIALRAGTTFINPQERFLVLEPNIAVLNRIPAQASIEFEPIGWARDEQEKLNVSTFNYRLILKPAGRLEVTVRNNNFLEERQLEVSAAVLDANGNVFAASRTRIEEIAAESERLIGFSWPRPLQEESDSIMVFVRKIPKDFLLSEI